MTHMALASGVFLGATRHSMTGLLRFASRSSVAAPMPVPEIAEEVAHEWGEGAWTHMRDFRDVVLERTNAALRPLEVAGMPWGTEGRT